MRSLEQLEVDQLGADAMFVMFVSDILCMFFWFVFGRSKQTLSNDWTDANFSSLEAEDLKRIGLGWK